MPKKTNTKAGLPVPTSIVGLRIPSGQEIFDSLMQKIEPELVTANLRSLDKPYAKETPAQKKARYKRYAKAFTQCKKEMNEWSMRLKRAVQVYKKALFSSAKKYAKTKEDSDLSFVESQMNIS